MDDGDFFSNQFPAHTGIFIAGKQKLSLKYPE